MISPFQSLSIPSYIPYIYISIDVYIHHVSPCHNVHLSQMAATARAVGAIETGEVGAGYGDRDGDLLDYPMDFPMDFVGLSCKHPVNQSIENGDLSWGI
jgi:hypothetical protein